MGFAAQRHDAAAVPDHEIVDSDNECPKAWLMRDNGTGYDKVTQQANALGAKNTTLHYLDVRTTSADLALILTNCIGARFGTTTTGTCESATGTAAVPQAAYHYNSSIQAVHACLL